jgi:hypothetical protein
MSLRALVVTGIVVALLGVAWSRRRSPQLPAMLALTVVVAVSVYHSARAGVLSVHSLPRSSSTPDRPPAGYRADVNRPLAQQALARIPPGAPYAIVVVKRSRGEFWLRYVLSPRFCVDPPEAHWVLVLGGSPQRAGVRPVRMWRAGNDWLVRT